MMRYFLSLVLLFAILSCNQSNNSLKADLIIHHARIWTGASDSSFVQAIAIRGNTILATGTDAEMLALKGDSTELIDAGNKLITPGFISFPDLQFFQTLICSAPRALQK